MKRALIPVLFLLAASCVSAQSQGNVVYATAGPVGQAGPVTAFQAPVSPVTGAPYSATITSQSVQTLADGTRIVQTFNGSTARDSQGRTRQDALLPNLGGLSAANAPHLVFIRDPVNRVSFTLNLTDKTAQKIPMPGAGAGAIDVGVSIPNPEIQARKSLVVQTGPDSGSAGVLPPPIAVAGPMMADREGGETVTEDLGSQAMEGIPVSGTRTRRTIPTGQIGNDRPIEIVTEVWTSPDLKTVVYSKRSDPRTGEQTFQLTNIVRGEPEASLFTVPPDFKIIAGPQPIVYGPFPPID